MWAIRLALAEICQDASFQHLVRLTKAGTTGQLAANCVGSAGERTVRVSRATRTKPCKGLRLRPQCQVAGEVGRR
ncbi:hypothetical protein DQP58_17910 [Mycobacterium colombiense]|uniref:Uncharacterized protein n=1 Tax=Mycobacterium colombiense TaxID=339268 RepID=A0A329KCG4_9MYCO|nr:hypothetical protein DQP58_17910 [Mycobacterium colombiense]